MVNLNKCPHCGNIVTKVYIEPVTVLVSHSPQWQGVTYGCNICRKVLSTSIDPLGIKADLIEEIKDILKSR